MIRVEVGPDPFDAATAAGALEQGGAGGIATFTGLVRADGGVSTLELEHYPGMTERVLRDLADEATRRWDLSAAIILHRVGPMTVGERIVFVGTAAAHRGEAIAAMHFLIDRLKTDAPFWKREHRAGGESWIEARAADDDAADRWRE
ncbi:molybdenum cofactor biosynthesis protein MoaE [Stakelama pacifica]|uniref:Molybdopterin synthase catalytic subunit n=1 Tax=Stakelama pacifica TaxID=517720 RepID=A0A4R6FI79_9SPHN|nr:molybdenum cofactor biosynthesis protein MoaE [Stakelama pacifica]TDN81063.1 molybdopterin synthase catalytic subunit [Stakelama pacifica]GGO96644.1 molybdopterin synthase catalytic subunit [Stakelama pacifica]